MQVRETAPHLAASFAAHARAFVEVQNGCDHRCTFCVIPFGRGASRSVPAGAVIDRIAALRRCRAPRGRADRRRPHQLRPRPARRADARHAGRAHPAPRARARAPAPVLARRRSRSTTGCSTLLTGEPRVMPHLHLSLQAGDDMILKRMKRRHSRARRVALVERLKARAPGHRDRRRPDRRLPDRGRGDVRQHARADRRLRHRPRAHLPLFAARRHARRADAAGRRPTSAASARPRLREAGARRASATGCTTLVGTTQHVLVERAGDRGHAGNFARSPPAPHPRDPATIVAVRDHRRRRDDSAHRNACMSTTPTWHDTLLGGFRAPPTGWSAISPALGRRAARRRDARRDRGGADRLRSRPRDRRRASATRLAEGSFERDMEELGIRADRRRGDREGARPVAKPLEIDAFPRPQVILVIGVNGSGKTTTIAKLAHLLQEQDYGVMLAAGDTFRAAAIGQLATWAERVGVPIVTRPRGRRRGGHRLRSGQAGDRDGHRRADRRHRRAPAEQARADGRAGQDPPRARPAQPRARRTTSCSCSTRPPARTRSARSRCSRKSPASPAWS